LYNYESIYRNCEEEGFMMWEQVGNRLLGVRVEKKMSQERFGELLGVSGQHIGRLERGEQRPSSELIVQIYNTTGVSADYILFGVENLTTDPAELAEMCDISIEQTLVALDIIRRVAMFAYLKDGNEAMIREVHRQQIPVTV
jgi:transcriptional regulator with XRE-family HTH domain